MADQLRVFVHLNGGGEDPNKLKETPAIVFLQKPLRWDEVVSELLRTANADLPGTIYTRADLDPCRLFLLPGGPSGIAAELTRRSIEVGVRDNDHIAISRHREDYKRPDRPRKAVGQSQLSSSLPPRKESHVLAGPLPAPSDIRFPSAINVQPRRVPPPPTQRPAYGPTQAEIAKAAADNRKKRYRSISGKMGAMKKLFSLGVISNDEKGILKDLLVQGDNSSLEEALDNYVATGNTSQLTALLNEERTKLYRKKGDVGDEEFKTVADLLVQGIDMDGLAFTEPASYVPAPSQHDTHNLLPSGHPLDAGARLLQALDEDLQPWAPVQSNTAPTSKAVSPPIEEQALPPLSLGTVPAIGGGVGTFAPSTTSPGYRLSTMPTPQQASFYSHQGAGLAPASWGYVPTAGSIPGVGILSPQMHMYMQAGGQLHGNPLISQQLSAAGLASYGAAANYAMYLNSYDYLANQNTGGRARAKLEMPNYPPPVSKEERKKKIQKWLEKRARRDFSNKSSYPVRRNIATQRKRGEDGRFIKTGEKVTGTGRVSTDAGDSPPDDPSYYFADGEQEGGGGVYLGEDQFQGEFVWPQASPSAL